MTDLDVLQFLVGFVQMDLESLRPGDFLNLQDDFRKFMDSSAGRGDVLVSVEGLKFEGYSQAEFRDLQKAAKPLLLQSATEPDEVWRDEEPWRTLGRIGFIPVSVKFHVIRHPGDFALFAVAGKLRDLFLIKVVFLLSRSPIKPILECPECGKIFYRTDKRQKFCQRRCSNLAGAKRYYAKKKARLTGTRPLDDLPMSIFRANSIGVRCSGKSSRGVFLLIGFSLFLFMP